MQEELLFIVAGEIVKGDSCELVDFLVVGGEHEFFVDYFFSFFEEIDGFLELN